MKKKTKALIAMMSLCAVGTVGSAFALTRNGATATGTSGAFDKAIYLYWGSEQSSTTLEDCDDLVVGKTQYRYLSVSPKSTKSVAGNVKLTFTLAASTGDYHVNGITISVYKTDALLSDATVENGLTGLTPVVTLDEEALTGNCTFAVAAAEGVHETNAYYAIAIDYDGTNVANKTLGGQVTISQSFAVGA